MKDSMTKTEKSWVMYDWANSSFATIMLAAIFPTFFASIAKNNGVSGDMWWGIDTSIATAITAVLAPFLGAIADYHGMKKKLFTVFWTIGLVFTGSCAFTTHWQYMLVGYVLAYIGFSGSCLYYDSFLTDITTPERMDKVSTWGYGMGYIGGSTIPFVLSIILIMFGKNFGIDKTMAVKISLILTVVWWGLFSIPFMKNCKQMYSNDFPQKRFVTTTIVSLWKNFIHLMTNTGVLFFILAYFFYIDGVNTVIGMATAYGATLGLDTTSMILALLITQLIAFPFAILFGKIARKIGTINMLTIAICIYFVICTAGFIMGLGLEDKFLTIGQATAIFWGLSVLVGTVQGGIQALSRSYFGRLVPPEKSNESFGILDILGKFSAVMGPAIYAFVKGVTGRSSYSIFAIIILFVIGGFFILAGKQHFKVSEALAENNSNRKK